MTPEERREYGKKYRQRPEVKERKKKYMIEYWKKPENKKYIKEYIKEYNQRPEVKEHNRVRGRKYLREYRQIETTTAREKRLKQMREYGNRPEVKERRKEYYRAHYHPHPRAPRERPSPCKTFIKKHHEEMQNDPERLTTDFLINITGCNCKRRKEE